MERDSTDPTSTEPRIDGFLLVIVCNEHCESFFRPVWECYQSSPHTSQRSKPSHPPSEMRTVWGSINEHTSCIRLATYTQVQSLKSDGSSLIGGSFSNKIHETMWSLVDELPQQSAMSFHHRHGTGMPNMNRSDTASAIQQTTARRSRIKTLSYCASYLPTPFTS
jgi:hypothetical protein